MRYPPHFGTPLTQLMAPYCVPPKAPVVKFACGTQPISAHHSRGSWPHMELHRRPQWQSQHGVPLQIAARPITRFVASRELRRKSAPLFPPLRSAGPSGRAMRRGGARTRTERQWRGRGNPGSGGERSGQQARRQRVLAALADRRSLRRWRATALAPLRPWSQRSTARPRCAAAATGLAPRKEAGPDAPTHVGAGAEGATEKPASARPGEVGSDSALQRGRRPRESHRWPWVRLAPGPPD